MLVSLGFGVTMISLPETATYGRAGTTVKPTLAIRALPDSAAVTAAPPAVPAPLRTSVEVAAGDNLALIFSRLAYPPETLHAMLESGEAAERLKRLYPGQVLQFTEDDRQRPVELRLELSATEVIEVSRRDGGFESRLVVSPLERRTHLSEGTIVSSLFLAGQQAGLSDNLIMQLTGIFGWDIDFALEVREGDQFRVLYEELYKDGNRVRDGAILAAEFRNRGHVYRAVRYAGADGRGDYYSDSGASMRKAFLRTPLNFTRISSAFDLRRKHPILNRIRAHRGVDYAAPTGTPIKATGDGTVVHLGAKGGYGRVIILRHAGIYSTLYAHMSRYAKGLRVGSRVSQGQVIGYVGMSGLATGPHLHYEFQMAGVHRNPLTVPLPNAPGISGQDRPQFEAQTAPLLAQLGGQPGTGGRMLALEESSGASPEIH